MDHMDLTDIYKPLPPTAAEYIFLTLEHGLLSRIDHVISHKTSLKNKILKFKICHVSFLSIMK
jgi:hypothetical protein